MYIRLGMYMRFGLLILLAPCVAGCFKTMAVDVAPPSCTVDEKSPECYSQPQEPSPMSEDAFFKDSI